VRPSGQVNNAFDCPMRVDRPAARMRPATIGHDCTRAKRSADSRRRGPAPRRRPSFSTSACRNGRVRHLGRAPSGDDEVAEVAGKADWGGTLTASLAFLTSRLELPTLAPLSSSACGVRSSWRRRRARVLQVAGASRQSWAALRP
jgi:hypothetical protein